MSGRIEIVSFIHQAGLGLVQSLDPLVSMVICPDGLALTWAACIRYKSGGPFLSNRQSQRHTVAKCFCHTIRIHAREFAKGISCLCDWLIEQMHTFGQFCSWKSHESPEILTISLNFVQVRHQSVCIDENLSRILTSLSSGIQSDRVVRDEVLLLICEVRG
jgi:hypothetical protein